VDLQIKNDYRQVLIFTEPHSEKITVILKCPKCGHEQEFWSVDFENITSCEKCDYSNEAWFFWHKPKNFKPRKGFVTPKEVWSIGAHYTNDALQLTKEEFEEYFYGGGKTWHGGAPYVWLRIYKTKNGHKYSSADVDLGRIYRTSELFEKANFLIEALKVFGDDFECEVEEVVEEHIENAIKLVGAKKLQEIIAKMIIKKA